jgi:hypothetical protein
MRFALLILKQKNYFEKEILKHLSVFYVEMVAKYNRYKW